MIKVFTYALIVFLQFIINVYSNEVKILYKINDSIITNYDVFEEVNYLVSLNKSLTQLNKKQLSSTAEKSLIRENPTNIWVEAKSALVFGLNYGPDYSPFSELKNKKTGYISIYARRKDYHKVIKSKLKND